MDSISQAVLGATIGSLCQGKTAGRKATLWGAALGTLPDLDVFIRYRDPVESFTYHRGFSHSLFVLSALAIVLGLMFSRTRLLGEVSWKQGFWFSWWILITHALLDALTAYGTQLFWPIPVTPTSIASLFIIDPLYTAPLFYAFIASLFRGPLKTWRIQRWAMIISCAYIGWSLLAQGIVTTRIKSSLAQDSQARVWVTPSPFNTLVWQTVIIEKDRYRTGFMSVWGAPPQATWQARFEADLTDDARYQRLYWFTGDRVAVRIKDDNAVATDLRMGFLDFHPFQFVVATREDGTWQPVPTGRFRNRGNWQALKTAWLESL